MAQRESGYERKAHDLYPTPAWCTEALIPHLPPRPLGILWEPACGDGAMCKVLADKLPMAVLGTDIQGGIDFLSGGPPAAVWPADMIVTNPPYSHATQFVEHALRLMEPRAGVVAMLLRTDFAHAKSRQFLFRDCPAFARKVELLRRITWFKPEAGAKGKSPSENHAWFVWDWRHEGPPTIGFAP